MLSFKLWKVQIEVFSCSHCRMWNSKNLTSITAWFLIVTNHLLLEAFPTIWDKSRSAERTDRVLCPSNGWCSIANKPRVANDAFADLYYRFPGESQQQGSLWHDREMMEIKTHEQESWTHIRAFMFCVIILLITKSEPLTWLLSHKCHVVHLYISVCENILSGSVIRGHLEPCICMRGRFQ